MASTVKPNRRPFPRCFTTAGKKTPARLARRGDTTRERSRNATNERHIGAYSFSFREGIATRDRAESSLNETPCAACENRKQTQRERERESKTLGEPPRKIQRACRNRFCNGGSMLSDRGSPRGMRKSTRAHSTERQRGALEVTNTGKRVKRAGLCIRISPASRRIARVPRRRLTLGIIKT